MEFPRLDRWLDSLSDPQMLLRVVWFGLVGVTLMLLLMMATRWGQSQPLKKCVFLSLLTHALLATYATTVEIVGASPAEQVIRTAIVEVDSRAAQDADATPAPQARTKPWEMDGAEPPEPDRPPLERSQVEPQVPSLAAVQPTPALLPTQLPVAHLPPVDAAPPDSTPLDSDDPAPALEAAEEESIQAPAARRREARELPRVERSSPAKAETPKAESPALLSSSPGLPGELADLPALPRMNDLPAVRPDPLSSTFSIDQPARTDTPLAAESLPEATRRPAAGSNSSSDLVANPLLTARPAAGGEDSSESPHMFDNRRAPSKAGIIASHGGSPGTEAAVEAALKWLAANQHADGRWDASRFGAGQERRRVGTQDYGHVGFEADNGISGLALLAFLGNGQTHLEGDYRETVERGLDFLIATQKTNGNLSGAADYLSMMYCHGMATLALSEAYGMTRDVRLLPPLKQAIGYTLKAQHPTLGGWRYAPGENRCDTSQLGWQLMALKSAELAGIEVPSQSRQGMSRFLQTVSSGRYGGLASYQPLSLAGERVTPSMTAEALVCRQFLGLPRGNAACDEAGNYIASELPSRGRGNFYYWYYATLAMFQLQGEHWQRWKDALEPTLLSTQRADGQWAGSWDPDQVWGKYGGRVYSTALGALCLEVYYRFLPLYVKASQANTTAP